MSTSGLKHAVIEQNNLEKRKSRRGTGGRTATLRRAPSDSDCSGETASLSADSDRHRPIPVAHTTLHSRSSRRRGSEWEVLEGLKDGQRFERRPEVFNGYLHKKRKWPLKGWHKRFFVIDGGILVYARSPTDVARGRLHGSVDVGLSVISAKQRRRRIDIDADEFIYHLRAKTPDVFRTWLSVLKAHRLYRQHLLTFGARESVPKSLLVKEDVVATDTSSRETVTRSTSSSLSNTSEESIKSSLKTFAPVSTYLSPGQLNCNPFSVSFKTSCTRCTRNKEGSFYTGCSESSLCHRKGILTNKGRKVIVSKNFKKSVLSRNRRNAILSRNDRKEIRSSKKEVVYICGDETGNSSDDLDVSRSEIYNRDRKESCFGFKTLCHCNKVDIRPTYFFFAKHRGRKEKEDIVRLPKSKKCTNLFKYKMKPEPLVCNRGVYVLNKRNPIPDQIECSNQTSFYKSPIKKDISVNSILKENFREQNLNAIMSETTFVNNEEHTDLESVNMKGSSKCDGNTVSLDSMKESIEDNDNVSMEIKSPIKLCIKSNEKLNDALYSSDNLLETAIHECVKRNFSKAGRIKHMDNIFSKNTLNNEKPKEIDNMSKITVNKDQANDVNLNYGVRENANGASIRTVSYTDPLGEIVAIPTIFPNYTKKPALDLPGWNSVENEVELRNKFYGDIKSKYSEMREKDDTKRKDSANNADTKCDIKHKTETYMNSNESSTDTAQIIKSGMWESMSDNTKEKSLEFSISNYKTAKVLVHRDSNCNDITITLKLNKEHCKKDVTTANPAQTKNKYRYCNYQVPKPKYFSPFIKTSEKIKSLALKHAAENNETSELSTENNSKPNEVAITTKITKTSTTDTTSTNSVGKRKVYLKMKSDIVPCAKSIKSFSTPKELMSSSSSKLKRKSFSDCGTKKILTLYVNNLNPKKPEEKKPNAPAAPIPFNYSSLSKTINFKSSTEKKPETANCDLARTIEKLTHSHDKATGSTDNKINISTTTSMSGLITTDVKEVSVLDFKETKEQATMPESETDLEVFLSNLSTAPIENLPPLLKKKSYVKCVAAQDSKSSLHTLKNPSNSSSVKSFILPSEMVTIADISEKAIQATYNQLQDLAVNTDFDSDPDSNPEFCPGFDIINKYIGSRLLPGAKSYLVPAAAIQTAEYSSSNISTERKKLKEVGSNTTGHIKLFHSKRRRIDKYSNSKAEMSDYSDPMLVDKGFGTSCYCNFGQQYYHTYQVLIDEKVAVTSVKPNINGLHRRDDAMNRCNGDAEPQPESGGPLENVSREIGQAQLSVQQLQRLMDALELQQQVHHDTDVSLEGASPNVKKDRRKFGLRKKKSNSKCTSVDPIPAHLEVSGSHMALSALTAPPSPGGGMPSSVPNSAASLPIACSAVRPQSLPGAESLTGTAGLPLSSFTPEHQLREDFAVLAKDLLASLKSVVVTLVSERSRLRSAMESADQGTPTNSAFVAALRSNLNTALQQNSELRSRLSRIHDTSDIAEMSSMGNNSDPVPRHLRQSMSFSSSCVSASEFFDAEPHTDDQSPERAGVIELDGDSSSEAGSLTSEDGASASSDNSEAGSHLRAAPTEPPHTSLPDPGPRWSRRSALPAPRPEPQGPSLWNLLYKNIGKDLSQISMPVTINEPLNMLQRLCEELEYSELLDAAAKNQDPMERMCLIAAFAVSAYASSSHRAASKPFNPLLGETYECRRTDRDFVFLAEQVSHHPPISACHAESPRWVFWQEARIKTKFWGKSMEFQPCSRVHVKLKASGDHYTWNKVTTCVHNLFGGQRWVDQYGDMHITCQGTDITCKLNFVKASSWSTSRHEVRGSAAGPGSRPRVPLTGRWSEALYAGEPPHNRCLWRPGAMPAEHELYYGFTRFAMELNELEPDMLEQLPPTDTRFRPDQRALEEGDIEAAEQYKYQLEEAQRERRKDKCEPTPRWFHKSYEYGEEMWVFNNEYWKAREAGFPDHHTRLW